MDFCQATVGTVSNTRFQFIKTGMPLKERYTCGQRAAAGIQSGDEIAIVFLKEPTPDKTAPRLTLRRRPNSPKTITLVRQRLELRPSVGHIPIAEILFQLASGKFLTPFGTDWVRRLGFPRD